MLKFADLSVDFKSYNNSLDSYMKLFPGSYTPLLIMYLAHKGLLKLTDDFDENDPHILVCVDGKSLHDFFGGNIMKKLIPDHAVWKQKNMTFEETFNMMNMAILKDRDAYVMLPFVHLWPSIIAGKSLALTANVKDDTQLDELIKCIISSDHVTANPAALLYFSVMLMIKYHPQEEDISKKSTLEEIEQNKSFYHELFVEDFEETLAKILSYSGNNYWVQPEELTRIILTQYKGGSIYNPFAGLASYAVQLHYDFCDRTYIEKNNIGNYYYGEDIKEMVWAVGKLRLLAHNSDSDNYVLGDSTRWRQGEANNILSTPPFVQIKNEDGKKEYADHFVIRRGIDMLTDNGLLACVVPISFMWRKDTADIRKRIVDEGLLESIIYLHENIFAYTSIRTAIVFIRKSAHSQVTFINASDAVLFRSNKIAVLDEDMIANLLYHKYFPYSGFMYDADLVMSNKLPERTFNALKVHEDNTSIAQANYDFTPGRLFVKKIALQESDTLIKMSSLVERIPSNAGKSGNGRVVRPALLAKDNFTSLLMENIPEGEFKKQYKVVNRSALLFSPLASLRPTLFLNPKGESVYLKADTVQAVYLKNDAIDPEYLVIELNKPYVQEQIRLLAKGDIIPRLKIEDFLSLQISVPDRGAKALSLEKEAVEQQKLLYFSKVNAELAQLKEKQHEDYVKMLRQRKHRIGQILGDLVPGFDSLDEFRIENGGVLRDSDVIGLKTGETVADYFAKLRKIIAQVNTLVNNLTDNEVWAKPTVLNIDKFLLDIPNHHLSDTFKFQFDIRHDAQGNKYYKVFANESHLSTVFENIISNAVKYGFTDHERNDYRIRITVDDGMIDNIPAVRISIANNGSPIHPSVDRSRFFDWGYGTGDGIGTWQLKDTVEHYKGLVLLNEYPDDAAGFCTEYEIRLPLIEE